MTPDAPLLERLASPFGTGTLRLLAPQAMQHTPHLRRRCPIDDATSQPQPSCAEQVTDSKHQRLVNRIMPGKATQAADPS